MHAQLLQPKLLSPQEDRRGVLHQRGDLETKAEEAGITGGIRDEEGKGVEVSEGNAGFEGD